MDKVIKAFPDDWIDRGSLGRGYGWGHRLLGKECHGGEILAHSRKDSVPMLPLYPVCTKLVFHHI